MYKSLVCHLSKPIYTTQSPHKTFLAVGSGCTKRHITRISVTIFVALLAKHSMKNIYKLKQSGTQTTTFTLSINIKCSQIAQGRVLFMSGVVTTTEFLFEFTRRNNTTATPAFIGCYPPVVTELSDVYMFQARTTQVLLFRSAGIVLATQLKYGCAERQPVSSCLADLNQYIGTIMQRSYMTANYVIGYLKWGFLNPRVMTRLTGAACGRKEQARIGLDSMALNDCKKARSVGKCLFQGSSKMPPFPMPARTRNNYKRCQICIHSTRICEFSSH